MFVLVERLKSYSHDRNRNLRFQIKIVRLNRALDLLTRRNCSCQTPTSRYTDAILLSTFWCLYAEANAKDSGKAEDKNCSCGSK